MYLSDCVCKIGSQTELFILNPGPQFEAAKAGRDRITQALLPIHKRIDSGGELVDMLENDQCQAMIATLGAGVQIGQEATFDLERMRYARLIIVTDTTPDGIHIRNEVLRYLSTYAHPVIEAGLVYVPEFDLEPNFTQEEFDTHLLNPETRRLKQATPDWIP